MTYRISPIRVAARFNDRLLAKCVHLVSDASGINPIFECFQNASPRFGLKKRRFQNGRTLLLLPKALGVRILRKFTGQIFKSLAYCLTTLTRRPVEKRRFGRFYFVALTLWHGFEIGLFKREKRQRDRPVKFVNTSILPYLHNPHPKDLGLALVPY